ncbi:NAD(P)-binding protein [Durotheca rogersii]|uniref:NAD(P)-binding protein n=1 Tax=Durotheca rogersii TaxID=419775 RepID=UPI002220EBE5|nr:NAD(P)-binding protein [Durotheca rogersii]KAI5867645.1 NAD(P)-binding protein [Durotheca rogersii]
MVVSGLSGSFRVPTFARSRVRRPSPIPYRENMEQSRVHGFAVVAGAAGGIGMEVAFTLASAGARGILFGDTNYDGVANAARESKSLASNPTYQALSVKLNVTDPSSVKAMMDLAVKEFGRIDYFVNAVGVDVAEYVPFEETADDDYDRVLEINAKGSYLLSKAAVKVMKDQEPLQVHLGRHGIRDVGRGAIVHVCSAMAVGAVPWKAPYVASKHAMLGLTRACAMDCKPYDIRVNQVCPAWTKTPMYEEDCRRSPLTPQVVERLAARKRPMEAYEVAASCLYLCSPGAVSITGTSIMMDCGVTIGPVL